MKKKKPKSATVYNFSEFISEPTVAMALLAFALIALVLSILEFSGAVSF